MEIKQITLRIQDLIEITLEHKPEAENDFVRMVIRGVGPADGENMRVYMQPNEARMLAMLLNRKADEINEIVSSSN